MNLKEMIKNKKIVTASIVVLLVAGVAVGGKVYADKEQEKKAEIAKVEKRKQAKLQSEMVAKAQEEEKNKEAKQVEKAKQKLLKIYKDNKVISTDSKLYESAKKEIESVKDDKVKKELLQQLAKVKQEMDKKAKEVAKKTENESKQIDTKQNQAKQQEVQEEQPVSQQQVAEQPVYQEAVAPTSNNDWGGQDQQQPVQEQVQSVPAPPSSGGNQAPEQPVIPPSSGGSQDHGEWVPDMGWGEQTGDIDGNGGSWTGGWEEVK
ncbi:hypothetical protein BCR24_06510 [Enterococcus ureilyticus]|uniref:Uncharacterized protein n=1 Tax=Enterococcus ureilyticus TaxID=1131292 RepID=A0A1E5H999_9ENTE|nr:hypothetical protein [Enterococcus ureilyticus]MBM7688420.1 glucan-binding YG repeat protein [Enterococcus ureilyticus]OEG21521.1 hypothetical protein BCR24_06510 [Enterococcus ureilyticus]